MSTLWSSSSNLESFDELKNKLVCTNLELESAKSLLTQERIKSHETVKHLLSLLRNAWQERDEALKERDEARNDLHALLNKVLELKPIASDHPLHDDNQYIPNLPDFTNFCPPIEGSNNISDACYYNNAPTLLSPTKALPNLSSNNVEGFSDSAVISPGTVDNHQDRASAAMERLLAKGKALPEKGKLLQAVVEAGPLLQTLALAPIPKWKNPPPLPPPNNDSFQCSPSNFLSATNPSPPQATSAGMVAGAAAGAGVGVGFNHVPQLPSSCLDISEHMINSSSGALKSQLAGIEELGLVPDYMVTPGYEN